MIIVVIFSLSTMRKITSCSSSVSASQAGHGVHQAAACCCLSATDQLDKAKLQFIFFQVEQLPVHGGGNRDRARTHQP